MEGIRLISIIILHGNCSVLQQNRKYRLPLTHLISVLFLGVSPFPTRKTKTKQEVPRQYLLLNKTWISPLLSNTRTKLQYPEKGSWSLGMGCVTAECVTVCNQALACTPATFLFLCYINWRSLKGSNHQVVNVPGELSPSIFFLLSTFVNKLKMQQIRKFLVTLQTLLAFLHGHKL